MQESGGGDNRDSCPMRLYTLLYIMGIIYNGAGLYLQWSSGGALLLICKKEMFHNISFPLNLYLNLIL